MLKQGLYERLLSYAGRQKKTAPKGAVVHNYENNLETTVMSVAVTAIAALVIAILVRMVVVPVVVIIPAIVIPASVVTIPAGKTISASHFTDHNISIALDVDHDVISAKYKGRCIHESFALEETTPHFIHPYGVLAVSPEIVEVDADIVAKVGSSVDNNLVLPAVIIQHD